MLRGRALLITLVALVAASLSGCGLGPGRGTGDVTITVTRSFGTVPVGAVSRSHVAGSETVMRLLQRSFKVGTRYGGGFVESIDGASGSSSRLDWFYYVNGIEATQGAATTAVHHGDRIWWDLHHWSVTDSIPAVVGSFPEPFVHGSEGRRYPTVLECGSVVSEACATVTKAFSKAGVPVASQYIGTGSGSDSLAVVVGTWKEIAGEVAADLIEHGPAASGIYARFAGPGGNALQLLDPQGAPQRTLTAGAGLIAATATASSTPVWFVTGTDPAGVNAAAGAFNATTLQDHFALAVSGRTDIPLPVDGSQ